MSVMVSFMHFNVGLPFLQWGYTILVCLRLDIYSALELYHLFNPTLLSIEIDYKSV